ncbi:hypothetical protein [Ralstonia mojiangensis]|uniref:hypothetical protein n=1 Tax=Ralstonia mojiangensis TaxID=2953895 RepID=UPI0028C3A32E|nr:hypothetical protein [Ralstonia mojiangensis]
MRASSTRVGIAVAANRKRRVLAGWVDEEDVHIVLGKALGKKRACGAFGAFKRVETGSDDERHGAS